MLARISQKEVTRIAFERNRIRRVTGNAGEFVLEKDEEKGQIFIRPTATESTKPINLFVMSDRGTVALLLQPVDMPSDTIVIREGRGPVTSASSIERSGRHIRTIKNLLLAMAADVLPDDMEVRELAQEMTLWPAFAWFFSDLLGRRDYRREYQLANITTSDVSLTERDLYKTV